MKEEQNNQMVSKLPTSTLQPIWLTKAFSFLDIKELKGSATNPIITAFYKDCGVQTIHDDETPWCAAFVGAILERSRIQSTKSLMARSYLNWGQRLQDPVIGALAIFKRGNSQTQGHVGFVVGQTSQKIFILGGNQSDAVTIAAYSKSQLLGVRWPNENSADDPKFQAALSLVLKMEGGWSNHPKDKGGATNQGITLKTYQQAIDLHLIPHPNKKLIDGLRTISVADVRTIYHHQYWQKSHCSCLPEPLAIIHFDAAVNHGVSRAIKFLQEVSGADIDGEWGPQTEQKAQTINLAVAFQQYKNIRRRYYLSLYSFPTFGKGWLNRLKTVFEVASNSLVPDFSPPQSSKNNQKDNPNMTGITTTTHQKWWGESLTIWGTIVTALATILPIIAPFIGFDITSEMVAQFGSTIAQLIQIIGGLTGTTMAFYGRTRANSRLTRRDISLRF